MGFQGIVGGQLRIRYEKLSSADEKVVRPRRRWVKKMNGRLRGLRLARSKKLTLKAFSVIFWPRIVRICADVVNRMKTDGICPTIIFSSQWGLPVLSHSSIKCRKSGFSLDRNLNCF